MQHEKILRVKMSDGTVYDIPAEVIAEHRARYFENNSALKLTYHASSMKPRLYGPEMEFALNNDDILIGWAQTRMTWKELEPHAVKVDTDKDYDKEWPTAEKKIITC
ncbi:hypothetical protein [Thermoclostridium stercorarium]|uniref:hypothetical protein n=1 Tax=Thermoclostridium stercorarium TaxID=1510 RepID=UPI002092048E|nr:hypothetical protein [Thermoclostridium stercorarium]